MTDATTPVTITVLDVEQIRRGRLLALASVEVEIVGIVIRLQGVKIAQRPDGSKAVESPCYRGPDGRWLPAAVLPSDLAAGLADEVFRVSGEG